jgi:hypothetical protein
VLAAGDGDEVARRIVSTNAELAIAVTATSGFVWDQRLSPRSTEELWPFLALHSTIHHWVVVSRNCREDPADLLPLPDCFPVYIQYTVITIFYFSTFF